MSAALQSYQPFPASDAPGLPAPRAYTVQDLGAHFDGSPLLPIALNDHGHLAVYTAATEGAVGEPALQHGLCLTGYLRVPAHHAAGQPPVTCIARNGFAAGACGTTPALLHAWCTPRGIFGAELWPEFTSVAHGINARGHVVGHVLTMAEGLVLSRAFLLGENPEARFLTPPSGGTTVATAINDAGDILLNATPLGADASRTRAWCFQGGRYAALPSLGGTGCGATALTAFSRAAGWALTSAGERHPCLWDEHGTTDLGTFPVHAGEALALNDHRTVVGRLADPQGNRRAFRWTPEDDLLALDHLLVAPGGWRLLEAVAVNAQGQIAAHALLHGQPRGVLLHPVALG